MPDPTSSNLKLALPTRGSDVGTWDVPVNGNSGILDNAFGGVASVALTNVPVSLSVAQAQNSVIRFSGALSGNVTVTLPAIVKFWTVQNNCTGAFVITLTNGAGNIIGIPPGNPMDVFSDGTNVYFKNLEQVGTYVDDAGASVPAWVTACTVPPYLNCDGSAFSSSTYPALFAKLGTTTLPDLRGRNRFALNQGTGRITSAGSGIDGDTRFSAGGFESITLDQTMIPAHTHTANVSDPTHSHTEVVNSAGGAGQGVAGVSATSAVTSVQNTISASTGITVTNSNTGGGLSHNNMPPAQISGITMIRAG